MASLLTMFIDKKTYIVDKLIYRKILDKKPNKPSNIINN